MAERELGEDRSIYEAIRQIARWSNRPDTRVKLLGRAGQDLSPIDVDLLRAIVAAGPVRVSDLAQWQGVDKSTMSPQVRRLELRELIRRRPDPVDKRAVLLAATAKGQRTCQRMDIAGTQVIAQALEQWPGRDRQLLATLLSRFADDLTASDQPRRSTR
ncbi:MarR family winged helix-turn-helix transcriptional regulator [Mycolicibacterium sp. XJ1819]